ncbi:zinc finger protein [Penicillium brevicompactum]|uniref:Zinc finger PHD-finger n=1 Tax=Penicillium brevicompactum TaxID=5074 RepID=UPI002540C07A|nr:Zinc finger PHD-finger [Penicillium brevicompactum]KAJ5347818.1 Zinc finger PHD-finger [Penicillium brevicompactum]
MQIPATFMDLPAPNLNAGAPQSIPESHIIDSKGPAEAQLPQPDVQMDEHSSADWEISAQAQLEANLMTSAETPTSSRTRPARRTTQPAGPGVESAIITIKPKAVRKTKAPTKRKRLIRPINIVCTGCYRGNSPSNNFIVLCDGCDRPWHQKCHTPNIDNEVVQIMDMDWFCNKCTPNKTRQPKAKMPPKKPQPAPKKTMSPPKVSGNKYTGDERRAYLSSLSHDALVDLLLNISNDWPLVPIFPPNIQTLSSSTANQPSISAGVVQAQAPATQSTGPLTHLASPAMRTPARISYAESSDSEFLTDGESDAHSPPHSPVISRAASQHENDYDSEDYRAYPEAGQGFVVPMTVEDLDIMAEDDYYPTFSHSIRGSGKAQEPTLGSIQR